MTIVDTVTLDGLKKVQMTAYRDFGRKQKREVSLEYLISETPLEPFTTDTYFEQYDQPTVFAVKGQEIVVASKRLADALLKLTEQRRNVLFLYFSSVIPTLKSEKSMGETEVQQITGN